MNFTINKKLSNSSSNQLGILWPKIKNQYFVLHLLKIQLIQIKRSQTQITPGSLRVGELAYSMTDSGLKLYIGAGSPDSFQMADSVQSIGGRFYTKRLDVDSLGISEPGKYLLLGD